VNTREIATALLRGASLELSTVPLISAGLNLIDLSDIADGAATD